MRVKFKLDNGDSCATVQADALSEIPGGTIFLRGMNIVAELGPDGLIIHNQDGRTISIEREKLSATAPFEVEG